MIPSFGIRISLEFKNMNLDLDNIAEFKIPDVPPWTFSQPCVLFSLHNDKKSQTNPLVFRTKFHDLLSDYPYYETIFTVGSKDSDTAALTCVTPSDIYKCRLPDNASIFSAEIKDHIEQSRNSDFIIFSDSLSVHHSLHYRHTENPLLLDILLKHNDLADLNHIVFVGFPVTVSCVDAATQTDPVLITAAPQSSSYNAASTEASASSQRDSTETMSQKEKQKQEKADKKLKQLIRDTLPKPKRNPSARTPDPKQRGKEKSVQNTDRQPKGSDDPIRHHNRFSSLEDMEAEESPSCIPKGTLNRIPTT